MHHEMFHMGLRGMSIASQPNSTHVASHRIASVANNKTVSQPSTMTRAVMQKPNMIVFAV